MEASGTCFKEWHDLVEPWLILPVKASQKYRIVGGLMKVMLKISWWHGSEHQGAFFLEQKVDLVEDLHNASSHHQ